MCEIGEEERFPFWCLKHPNHRAFVTRYGRWKVKVGLRVSEVGDRRMKAMKFEGEE